MAYRWTHSVRVEVRAAAPPEPAPRPGPPGLTRLAWLAGYLLVAASLAYARHPER